MFFMHICLYAKHFEYRRSDWNYFEFRQLPLSELETFNLFCERLEIPVKTIDCR